MHKLLYFATIGLLAFSIGGCGGEGSNTASPSPSPSAASPSPAASASPTPGTQTFQSPIVAAQPPGLIRSTNPDERARQAQTDIGDNKNRNPTLSLPPVAQGPLTANPSQADPFGPLPPIALQIPPGAGGVGGMTSALPKLPQRQVAVLPKLPEFLAPPPIGAPVPGTQRGPEISGPRGTQQVAGRPGDPLLPGGNGAQLGSPPQVPGIDTPQLGRGGRNGSLPGGNGAQLGSLPQVPGLNAPQLGRLRTSPPGLEPIAARPIGVPDLPELPVEKRPTQWKDPNARVAARPLGTQTRRSSPPRPPQPIAARPIGVPNLPELPVDKRPPQWVDPNPPPPPQIPVVPPPPSTDLATGTEVSGVVKVGNETQVIVKVPNEPTSRYVKVGQRLSNGQVLVKRVDIKQGADPIVILEENGVEVAKAVGEKPASRQQPANAVISRLPITNSSSRR
ncbi:MULTISPECIES: hypothetical protein [unclassified Microcoleus]